MRAAHTHIIAWGGEIMATTGTGMDQKNIFRVVKVVPEDHDTYSLFLEGSDEGFAHRKAGQYASIRLMRAEGWSEPHPFTISGAPEDSLLRLTIKKEGRFTSSIPDLKPGDPVKCMHNTVFERDETLRKYQGWKQGNTLLGKQDHGRCILFG
jgi:predicted ferric reductase